MSNNLGAACPHWNATIEPDGEHYTCVACGRVQSRAERLKDLEARAERQAIVDNWQAGIARAQARQMPSQRWRYLRNRLKQGEASSDEISEFCDESTRRDYESQQFAVEFGNGIGQLIGVGLIIWLAFIILDELTR